MYIHLRPTLSILILAAASGCNKQSDAPPNSATTPSAIAMPNHTPLTFAPIDGAQALTEESLQAVERKYACRLPDDYRSFLLSHHGAFPSPDCVVFEEAGRKTATDVFCFFALDDQRAWASMDWHIKAFSGRLPPNTLPIARDACGNLWLLSVSGPQVGSVYFWDHGSFETFDETDLANWPRVAASFTEFQDKLSTFDASAADDVVLSRYALVKQATEAMAKDDSGFSTRANPGYVWHCDCDDEGKVKMQFVQYEVHAGVTHTCGYSRLCAIKGLIQAGQPRLPE